MSQHDPRRFTGRGPTVELLPLPELHYPNPGPLDGEPRFPGEGYPDRPGERGGYDAMAPGWARLTHGQAIGKKTAIRFDAEDPRSRNALVTMISITGDDRDACQMVVTLEPPTVVPLDFGDLVIGDQNVTGEKDNREIRADGDFPGDGAPIVWPPIEVIVEYGCGGTSVTFAADYVNGMTINIPGASYLRVHARIATTERGEVSGTSAQYVVAAFAGPGYTRGGTAQKTVYVGTVAAGAESAVFSIPRMAKRAYLIGCDNTAAPQVTVGTIRWWQNPEGVAAGAPKNVGNILVTGNQPQAFDIPSGASYFSILSGSGVDQLFAVVFNLGL